MGSRFLQLANSADFYFLKAKKWKKGLIVFMMSKMENYKAKFQIYLFLSGL